MSVRVELSQRTLANGRLRATLTVDNERASATGSPEFVQNVLAHAAAQMNVEAPQFDGSARRLMPMRGQIELDDVGDAPDGHNGPVSTFA
jgi:hypothetical protein